ncbi:MAG: hypothetical protein ABI852_15825 [Gemmatimonadaceae bacterium]
MQSSVEFSMLDANVLAAPDGAPHRTKLFRMFADDSSARRAQDDR